MRKRLVIAGVAAFILLVSGITIAVVKKPSSSSVSPPSSPSNAQEERQFASVAMWDDPAGFSFHYPEGLQINAHNEDNDNYAHVELTSATHAGNLVVWAKDTNAVDVASWVKAEKQFAGSAIIDTSLGGQTAKKIMMEDKLVTGTIFDQLLFSVETNPKDKAFWTQVHDTVVDSFQFKPASESATPQDSADGVDEEETLQ